MSSVRTRDDVRALDASDPLAGLRREFVIDDDVVAYFDGNSLGRTPRATAGRLHELVEREWGGRLIRGWDERWMGLPERVGDRLSSVALGAAAGQTVIADSTTVNLYKVVHAAAGLRPHRRDILIDKANFPTDRFVVEAVAATRGMRIRWAEVGDAGGVTAEDLSPLLGNDTAVVVLSHVDYRSGFLADLESLTRLVHDAGAVIVWDLCHSAGVAPIGLDAGAADFAVGCTYKYLNAGPGAPAFLYVAARHLDAVDQPIAGWFGADDIFAMASHHHPAAGIRRMLSGTPNVVGIVAVDEGLELLERAGLASIRAKSVALTELAIALADALLAPLGWAVVTPRLARCRGGHVALRGPAAPRVAVRMTEAGVIPDFRQPDIVRLGFSPLTTTFCEVWDGLHRMRDVVASTSG